MPMTHFICPDGNTTSIADCLAGCPRRCMSLPTLNRVAQQRPWNGTPSTTQLIDGTRLAYLKIVKDYTIDPDDYTFTLLGSRVHERLDVVAKALELISEEKLKGEVTGVIDLLVPANGGFELWDYKTSGSYKIANALGLTSEPVHIKDWELQINCYRLLLQDVGFDINRQVIQAIARDGGTWISKKYGITRKINLIEIQFLDDDYVRRYFEAKKEALLSALEDGALPPMCDYDERWANRRCTGYCPVAEYCPEGRAMKKRGKLTT